MQLRVSGLQRKGFPLFAAMHSAVVRHIATLAQWFSGVHTSPNGQSPFVLHSTSWRLVHAAPAKSPAVRTQSTRKAARYLMEQSEGCSEVPRDGIALLCTSPGE